MSHTDWRDRVLSKVGARLCEHPVRVYAIQDLLSRVSDSEANAVDIRRQVELILGLAPFSSDLQSEIDVSLGLGVVNNENSTGELEEDHPKSLFPAKLWRKTSAYGVELPCTLFSTKDSLLAYRRKPELNHELGIKTPEHVTLFIKSEFDCLKDALEEKRQSEVSQNRGRIIQRHKKGRGKIRFDTTREPSHRKIGSLGWEGVINDSSNVPGNRPAPITRIERFPPYVASIPIKSNLKATDDEPYLTYVPAFPPRFKLADELLRSVVSVKRDFIVNFNEEAIEQVIHRTVLRFGPSDWTIAAITREFSLLTRVVRKVCAEVSLCEAPQYDQQNLPLFVRDTADPKGILESFRAVFCSRCGLFDCKLHGLLRPAKHSRTNVHPPASLVDNLLNARRRKPKEEARAFEALAFHSARLFPHDEDKAKALFQCLLQDHPYPHLANGSQTTTTTTDVEKSLPEQNPLSTVPVAAFLPSRTRVVHWPDPCDHSGPCGNNPECSCFTQNRYCELDCGCDAGGCKGDSAVQRAGACGNVFSGCRCKPVRLVIRNDEGKEETRVDCCAQRKECECRHRGRECAPHLCTCCCSSSSPISLGSSSSSNNPCRNMNIQSNSSAPCLAVGFSSIHEGGWGSFATRDISKGEFVGEYCGEIIDDNVANMRGFVYDKITKLSFLFELSRDHVVDSLRRGTDTKWINFAPDRGTGYSSSSSSVRSSEPGEEDQESDDSEEEHVTKRKGKSSLWQPSVHHGRNKKSDTGRGLSTDKSKKLSDNEYDRDDEDNDSDSDSDEGDEEDDDVFDESSDERSSKNGNARKTKKPEKASNGQRLVAIKSVTNKSKRKRVLASPPSVTTRDKQTLIPAAALQRPASSASDVSSSGTGLRWLTKSPSTGGGGGGDSHQLDSRKRRKKRHYSNCSSSVMYVDGEPRICLFARHDIKKGEELCFNYGKFRKIAGL